VKQMFFFIENNGNTALKRKEMFFKKQWVM